MWCGGGGAAARWRRRRRFAAASPEARSADQDRGAARRRGARGGEVVEGEAGPLTKIAARERQSSGARATIGT